MSQNSKKTDAELNKQRREEREAQTKASKISIQEYIQNHKRAAKRLDRICVCEHTENEHRSTNSYCTRCNCTGFECS